MIYIHEKRTKRTYNGTKQKARSKSRCPSPIRYEHQEVTYRSKPEKDKVHSLSNPKPRSTSTTEKEVHIVKEI